MSLLFPVFAPSLSWRNDHSLKRQVDKRTFKRKILYYIILYYVILDYVVRLIPCLFLGVAVVPPERRRDMIESRGNISLI
eukprot:COSAG06_NODE_1927_length_8051_cov_7.015342_3_plen_80_part_00